MEDEKAVLADEAAAASAFAKLSSTRLAGAEAERDQLKEAVLVSQQQADQLIGSLRALAADKVLL